MTEGRKDAAERVMRRMRDWEWKGLEEGCRHTLFRRGTVQ